MEETVIQFGLCRNREKSSEFHVINYKVGKKLQEKSVELLLAKS